MHGSSDANQYVHWIYPFVVAGDLPVVISCASVALADAGIMMYDLVTSVSVVRTWLRFLIPYFL